MAGLTLDPLIGGLQTVLDLRSKQHALTAANLANVETPGYRAKQLDFGDALRDAVSASRLGEDPGSAAGDLEITELEAPPWAVDGNSVFEERETARLTENSLMYRTVAKGVSRKLALLRYAASDGQG